MTVPDAGNELEVALPAWNALYMIRDFAHRVREVSATGERSLRLRVTKQDKQRWRIHPAGEGNEPLGQVVVQYSVFWDEPGPFSSQLNSSHAFINLANILFYAPARRAEDVRIEFLGVPAGWSIAVALKPGATSHTFHAASYDALVDAPVEISAFEEWRQEVAGARIRIAVHGSDWDRTTLSDTVRRTVAYQVGLMREVPFEEFLFIYHFGHGGGGGMEHRNSTAIHLAPRGAAAAVTAHEFFHVWNVKRIRPASLEPVDYSREQWTRALWFAEGVTNTYHTFTLVRTGLWTERQFYDDLAAQLDEFESRPASRWKSAEEASLDAWHEKYSLYNRPEFSISYYNKGQILGVLLDVLIRDAADNRASLDDVMRYLNREYAHQGRFYPDNVGIRAAVEHVAGRDFDDFFARHVTGADPLPAGDILALAGLELARNGRGYTIREMKAASERQRRIREGLLRGTTD
jgi:predicted metalloprotease with PDZ domain